MPNEETVKVGKYKVKGIYNYKKKKDAIWKRLQDPMSKPIWGKHSMLSTDIDQVLLLLPGTMLGA